MTDRIPSILFSHASHQKEDSMVRRLAKHLDWILFVDVLILSTLGLLMVHSASLRFNRPEVFLGKQFLAFCVGWGAVFFLATLNYQIFSQYPKTLFVISISLLGAVLLFGMTNRGTKAWLSLGPVSFQPSEICKLIVILILSGWCAKNAKEMKRLKSLAIAFLIVLPHIGLIIFQPDFGSTLVYFPVLLGILFVSGARFSHLLVVLFYGFTSAALLLLHTYLSLSPEFLETSRVWGFFHKAMSLGKEFLILQSLLGMLLLLGWWLTKQLRVHLPWIYWVSTFVLIGLGWVSSAVFLHSLKDYQKKRLIAFFNPGVDPLGAGYHVTQSVVALGSGKIFGKGLFSSTQGRLGFLPEQHTDFIFSMLGEELGFVTSGFVVLLYLILFWRCVVIASDSRDRFGSIVAIGIGSMFAFYTILNLTMVMGLAPVTGLPLPFLSYGGSALVSSLAAVGILLSIHLRRYTH